jgi:hypothetical protein
VTAILPVAPLGRLVHSSQVVDVVDAPARHAEPIGSRTLRGPGLQGLRGTGAVGQLLKSDGLAWSMNDDEVCLPLSVYGTAV